MIPADEVIEAVSNRVGATPQASARSCTAAKVEGNVYEQASLQTVYSLSQLNIPKYYHINTVIMAPGLLAEPIAEHIKDTVQPKKNTLGLPEPARKRLEKAGIDLSGGYPYRPAVPLYLDDVVKIRDYDREYVDPGSRADPEKKALLSAAKEVIHLTAHIGTEIVGLQLKDLTDQQKDELGLLIAERSVVFFRDQDISPQQQKALGEWYGEIEVHVRG